MGRYPKRSNGAVCKTVLRKQLMGSNPIRSSKYFSAKKVMGMWQYKQVYKPNHPKARSNGCVLEHRYVAEIKIGRYLEDGEVVHHIDEDKSNNDADNLVVFVTQDDHARFHQTGVMVEVEYGVYISPKLTKSCMQCGIMFECSSSRIVFCTQECSKKSMRVVDRPSKEELVDLLRVNNFTKIGEMFGVSDNSIRKWCKSYGIPSRRKDLKIFLNDN